MRDERFRNKLVLRGEKGESVVAYCSKRQLQIGDWDKLRAQIEMNKMMDE